MMLAPLSHKIQGPVKRQFQESHPNTAPGNLQGSAEVMVIAPQDDEEYPPQ